MKARARPGEPRRRPARPLREPRRRWAALACALWALGFDLGPALHGALHGSLGAHEHGGGAAHAHDPARHAVAVHHHGADVDAERRWTPTPAAPRAGGFSGWRDHGRARPAAAKRTEGAGARAHAHTHTHADARSALASGAAHAHAADSGGAASEGESPLDHGDGSLAHRDVCALLPLPGLPPVPAAPFAGWAPVAAPCELSPTSRPTRTRARGPPEAPSLHPLT